MSLALLSNATYRPSALALPRAAPPLALAIPAAFTLTNPSDGSARFSSSSTQRTGRRTDGRQRGGDMRYLQRKGPEKLPTYPSGGSPGKCWTSSLAAFGSRVMHCFAFLWVLCTLARGFVKKVARKVANYAKERKEQDAIPPETTLPSSAPTPSPPPTGSR